MHSLMICVAFLASDVKNYLPIVVSQPHADLRRIRLRPGEKSMKQVPVIAFEIVESGDVMNARLERSFGIADIDAYALSWMRSIKYNNRPGCGVIGSKVAVIIDLNFDRLPEC
jgi:hypothetical protein